MKEYRFKKFISTEEMSEVMKIVKYHRTGEGIGIVISEESYNTYPELQSYFEEIPNSPTNSEKETKE